MLATMCRGLAMNKPTKLRPLLPSARAEADSLVRVAKVGGSGHRPLVIKGGRESEAETASRLKAALQYLTDAFETASRTHALSDAERARLAADLASEFAARADAEAKSVPPLPDKAPILWAKRDRALGLNPVGFTMWIYGAWLGKGLTRSKLRELDKPLYHALANWISRHPEDDVLDLPSQSELIDRKIARLAEEFSPDELRRLGLALQARLQRSGN
jgi:hypothetical protein